MAPVCRRGSNRPFPFVSSHAHSLPRLEGGKGEQGENLRGDQRVSSAWIHLGYFVYHGGLPGPRLPSIWTGSSTHGAQMVYYSFVTLTTLGYGDIVPIAPSARALATLEAITGQLYLTVLVARLVGLHITHSSKQNRPKDQEES